MPTRISHLAQVDPRAELGNDVEIGPFCVIGPAVTIGAETRLDSHVTITGQTTVGCRNRFFPNSVIGGEPQDFSYRDADTYLEIGDDNVFREGVTVSRGAEKEDHTTRIGNRNLLMANAHVAHNCHVHNNAVLVNGVLLGGHVHVHDGAIVSGNSVVHHFSTIGTLAFISGGCRVPHDVPPYMLAAGNDAPEVKTVNLIGLRRAGVTEDVIRCLKRAHRLMFRECKKIFAVRETLLQEFNGILPFEATALLNFVEQQQRGKFGRAREALRNRPATKPQDAPDQQRRAA
jgi:UDP-N-acetylglucosamine acyltransferase